MGLAIQVTERLKAILKNKGITYRKLAEMIGLSEAAVKRAFAEEAFSLKRLEQISELLDIELNDFISPIEGRREKIGALNTEQDLLLATSEKLMCFFYLLAAEVSLNTILENYVFDETEIDRYLLDLDKVGLIRLGPNRQVMLLVQQSFYWPKGGELDKKYSPEMRKNLVESDFRGEHHAESFASGRLSSNSIHLIQKKIFQLEDEVRDLIKLDSRYEKGTKLNVTFYSCVRPWAMPWISNYLVNF